MRKWFAADANCAINKEMANLGIKHDNKPYPADKIDDATINWKWAISFPRVHNKALELVTEKIGNSNALAQLAKTLAPYKNKNEYHGLHDFDGNTHEYHQEFGFQHIPLDNEDSDKLKLYADIQKGAAPDDVLGALGAFQINAGVGKFYCVNHYKDGKTQGRVIVIESICLYVKDSYDFFDADEKGTSQYLGHWSRNGLFMAPLPLGKTNTILNPAPLQWWEHALLMDGKSVYEKGAVMYPVTNKDFRAWREKHRQGGYFLIYSKPVEFKLKKPLVVFAL
jgi:hypothetical protein